jgi:hypothetical protein
MTSVEKNRAKQKRYREVHAELVRDRHRTAAQACRAFARQQKVGRVCVLCGEAQLGKLDFHHIDPSVKKFTVCSTAIRSQKAILEEIAKCEVRCRSCHRKLHQPRSITS